jgi:hypothetical protein
LIQTESQKCGKLKPEVKDRNWITGNTAITLEELKCRKIMHVLAAAWVTVRHTHDYGAHPFTYSIHNATD